jgi:UDP-3-O-[3-hydroxymyristoyl] glucosamine N-acyltransferase
MSVKSLTLAELASALNADWQGEGAYAVHSAASLAHGQAGQIGFYADKKLKPQLSTTQLGVLILKPADEALFTGNKLLHPQPQQAFAHALALLYPTHLPAIGIHPTALVDPTATVHATARIGAYVCIGANSVVGADCVLHPRVTIYHGVKLAERVQIHSGAVLGADGFGYAPVQGQWIKVPQVGGVRIGADVEIGANTTIDRGALDDTVLGQGVKLDNQIQIGHNCVIGEHTAIAGCVGIAGSTQIGAHCMIGGAAMIAGHLRICDQVIISGGTLVASHITEPGQYTGVFPTLPHRAWAKLAGQLRHQIKS